MEIKSARPKIPDCSLIELIRSTPEGSQIVLDDLTDYCTSVVELGEVALMAYKKNIKMKVNYPAWFNMNGAHESPLITVIRMYNLQCEIDKKHNKV